jgi:hypothetical protein
MLEKVFQRKDREKINFEINYLKMVSIYFHFLLLMKAYEIFKIIQLKLRYFDLIILK